MQCLTAPADGGLLRVFWGSIPKHPPLLAETCAETDARALAVMTRPNDVDEIKLALRAMLPELRARWSVSYLGVFGSWIRREQCDGSDLDLLVDFDRPIGFELVALKDEIKRRVELPVDLVMRGSLRRRIGRQILDEVQPV